MSDEKSGVGAVDAAAGFNSTGRALRASGGTVSDEKHRLPPEIPEPPLRHPRWTVGDEKHRHETPPGYLGEQPEPADPHDHSTLRPAWRPGEPWVSSGIEDVLPASALAPAPRWHEIATDGLPPEGVLWVLVWTYGAVRIARRDEVGWLGEEDQVVSAVTHWHPLPAPPTR